MEKDNSGNRRILFGLFLVVIGIIWMFLKLNIIPDFWDNIIVSWQMLLVGIGVFTLIGGNKTAGTILIVIGGFFLIPEFFTVPYNLRRIGWPVLIICVGLVLLLSHRKREHSELPARDKKGADSFDDFVIFGGKETLINSDNFSWGKVTAIFGGVEYDMRQVNLSENGAVIDCTCVFGGCGFKVPPDWTVRNEINTIFGGFSDKRGLSATDPVTDPSKKLVIRGFSAFGGVEVKYK